MVDIESTACGGRHGPHGFRCRCSAGAIVVASGCDIPYHSRTKVRQINTLKNEHHTEQVMDAIFSEFAAADASEQGYALAATISPEPPKHDPARLYNFYRSANAHSLQTELRYRLQYNPNLQLDKQEASAWIEVFAAFHKFTGVLLGAEEVQNSGREVEARWGDVYELWKDVVTALVKGYQNGAFYAWTIPCLYVAGKYLRVFAIKADDSAALQKGNGFAYGGGIQEEDAFGTGGKHEKLEDAARQINRIFGLCVSDRYVYSTLHPQATHAGQWLR